MKQAKAPVENFDDGQFFCAKKNFRLKKKHLGEKKNKPTPSLYKTIRLFPLPLH